jgi:hypothetical protein
LRYDQAALELLSAEVGDFVPPGVRASIFPEIQERGGRAILNVDSLGDTPVSGSGSLLNLTFRSLTPRPTSMITLQQFAANGADGLMVPAIAPRPFTVIAVP